MENQEEKNKPQEEVCQEEELEGIEEARVEERQEEEEEQTQVEEGVSMEEKAQVEAREEQKGGGRGLVYLALIFAIVALVLSFWNVGVQRVVKVLEKQEKVLEARTRTLESTLTQVQAQALLSQIQLEAQKVYVLTMGEGNFEAAARVLSTMEAQINLLKGYYPGKDLGELEALVTALKKEVAKGPSPIPGLVSQIQFVSDEMVGARAVALPAPAVSPEPEAKPAKTEVKKERAIEQAPKEEGGVKAPEKKVKPQAGTAPEGKGALYNLLKTWNKLGEKLVGKK